MHEKIYYNAVAVAAFGDHEKIGKWKTGHGTWEETHRSLGLLLPDPAEEWRKVEALGIRLILLDDADYPSLLRQIAHPPFGIYVLGPLSRFPDSTSFSLSIVGTRRVTPEGKQLARHFGRELAQAGFLIVSGLAFGADSAAHEGCLEGGGITIAVLAGGLDDVYPHSHDQLAKKILAAGGALISEYPLGEPPHGRRFLERNRIISGLSRGTLIVEAPERSGSLVTAQFAFQQNRELFVIPGPVAHPNFKASHELIRQGATLVTAPEHIMEEYGKPEQFSISHSRFSGSRISGFDGTPEEKLILETLQNADTATEVDKLADITRLEPQAVNQAITFLVMKHLVREVAGGYIIE